VNDTERLVVRPDQPDLRNIDLAIDAMRALFCDGG
jgi:hypothetical protein